MKAIKRIITYLIILVFLFCLLPSALAYTTDNVLTAVTHTFADSGAWSVDGRTITLNVRYSFADTTLDLLNGLNISWDTAQYRSVVATPASASIAIDGTATVSLIVSYLPTDPESTVPLETEYFLKASKAAAEDPSFSGTVSKEIHYSTDHRTVELTSADFIPLYIKNDGADIGSIALTGSNPSFGKLRAETSEGNFDDYDLSIHPCISIDASNPADTIFTFEASSTGTVSYNVKAFAGSDTGTPIGNVVVTITSYTIAPQIHTPISDQVSKGTVKTFSESYFISRCNLYGVPPASVEITPTNTAFGVWSLGAESFAGVKIVPITQLENLRFTANATGTATFSWRVTTASGSSASSVGTFTIAPLKLSLSPYNATTPILKGKTWTISSGHFVYAPSAALSYIKITAIPAVGDGSLSLSIPLPDSSTGGYPAIAANTPLKANAVIPDEYLNYLYLTTNSASTNTAASFKWTATADAKVSTAFWADAVTYTVNFMSGGTLPNFYPNYYETDMNTPRLLPSDDIINYFSSLTGGDVLSYVTFKLPDKACGALYLNYDVSKKAGTAVTATAKYYASKSPNLSEITFVPAKDYTGTFDITYNAYSDSGTYTGQIKLKVSGNAGGTLSYITDKNAPIQFDAKDFQAAFLSATGKPLSHVYFSPLPASSSGYLCYNYTLAGDYDSAVSSGYPYYVYKAQYLSLVTFVPNMNFTGSVVIHFRGYAEGGGEYGGKLYIDVVDSPAGIVRYSVRGNGKVTLLGDDFSKEFIGVTGSLLSHVTFTPPPAASGSLYFKYDASAETGTKVASAIKYYDGKGPDISDLTFIPPKDFTGICVVPFTAYATSGASYAGKLKLTVFEGSDVISYSTGNGKPVSMNLSDFADAFYMNSDGRILSYVTFALPSASYGRFYYNYTSPSRYDYAVSSDKKFYAAAAPYLSNVSFVPQEGYTGSFSLTYTGYTSNGISCTGKIKITVSGTSGGSVSYETTSMTPVTFKTSDFVSAFAGKTGNPLYYVRFTQPNASFGTLYQRYNPQQSYNTQVYPSNNYYVNSSTFISEVTFVPNPSFSGVLAVSYTAYDAYGYSFSGAIVITVASSEIGTITYGTNMNKPVQFASDDFNTAFQNKTGLPLSYVTLTLPQSSAGTLYLGYNSPTSYTSAVSASAKYYRSYSPLLSDISYVPKTGYSGAVTIQYTGYTSTNSAFSGKIVINVGTDAPYSDMGAHTWAQDAVDYLYRSGVITDDGGGYFYPGEDMSRGEFMEMIANAFYLTGAGSGTFPDVPVGSPYYDAVAAAKAFDIARGDDTGLFHPEWGLTRQDAMVIIVRALKNTGTPLTPGTQSNLAGFSDASEVSDYAVSALAALVRSGFVEGSGGRLNPKTTFTRAESAMLLYRILIM